MIRTKSVLAVIPARGGSKGVRRKNLRDVAGKPLLAWTIEAAKKSKYIDRIVLSSEDAEIIETAKKWGCEAPFTRPKELAADATPGVDPVLHALDQLPRHDLIVLLQPTSPLRTAEDIDACLERCVNAQAPCVVSVAESAKSPYWMYELDAKGRMNPVLESRGATRQELPKAHVVNGAVYVAETDWFKRTKAFLSAETLAHVMPAERSLDVDSEFDLRVASAILNS